MVPGSYAEKWLIIQKGPAPGEGPLVAKEEKLSTYKGKIDRLVTEGFDHIKVPCIDSFYSEGLDNESGAFEFGNRPEWEEVWYEAYENFLIANGSPYDNEGNVYPVFYAINPGIVLGYQYLYYGFRGEISNGWGDIVLLPNGLHPTIKDDTNYKGSYLFETSNFFYGEMDKGLENEYRAATTMLLSWIVPNPQEVEKVIYDFHVDETGDAALTQQVLQHGFGTWMQVGEVDICVYLVSHDSQTVGLAIREHQ